MLLGSFGLWAQAPEQFNYQAVVRDGSGSLIKNQTVTVKIGIYDGGTLAYEESHSVNTDNYGLLNLQVGNGTATSGTFSNLDWANKQYQVKVEVDNGNGFQNLGQDPLSSVPYALHSASSDPGALGDLTDVNASSSGNNEVLKFNGTDWAPAQDNTGGGSAWSTSSGNVYYNSGRVGIGTSSPNEDLEVNGNMLTDTISFPNALVSNSAIYPRGAFALAINKNWEPSSTNSQDLGGSSKYWSETYSQQVYMDQIKDGPARSNYLEIEPDTIGFGSIERIFDGGSDKIGFNASLVPATDDDEDIGSIFNRWEDIYATNGTIQTSDRRSKKDITNLDYGLEEVMAIRPVTFRWKDKPQEKKKIGVIAQQVQPILSEVVKTHDWKRTEDGQLKKVKNERLGVYYADMIPVLIKAIQEQQSQIENLKKQKEELEELRRTVAELQAEIQNRK